MAEPESATPWQAQGLDATVSDYFEMPTEDFSGTPYVKVQHRAALMHSIGRFSDINRVQALEYFRCTRGAGSTLA
jgi:hypothetical protein